MKKILFLMTILSALIYVSCQDVYDKIKEFSPEEVIYPAHFDTIHGRIGYERVEIYLSKYGQIPSSQMNLGKAKKTVVYYGYDTLVYDSLCSVINITGLTLPNMYRFKVYTVNDEGDMSTPQEITMTPYTAADRDALALSAPDVIQSTSSALVEWKSRLSSDLYDVYAYSYEYRDRNGDLRRGGGEGDAVSFFVEDVDNDTPIPVDVILKIVPLVGREPILDTIYRTFTTTITVGGTRPVIFLDKPEIGAAFNNGFNSSSEAMTFSWRPVTEVDDYTLKISDSYSFPDEDGKTFTVRVGDVDSYTLTGEEQLDVYTLSENSTIVRPILYWTVVPTNGDANISIQTRQITGRKVIKLSPNNTNNISISTEAGGVYRVTVNGADPYFYTTNLNRIINPGASSSPGKLTLSFDYMSDIDCTWEFFFGRANAAANISIRPWVPRSDEWREAVFDIGPYMEQFDWGRAANHRFRIDMGDSPGSGGISESWVPRNRIVYITNIQINIY
ncbi:MAG: DUF4998 domain-containing protein [Prevotellaceae bacterium]|jgi:hypothetical protein|nr:DUF4998 domain-containing protein [Prevotellaceae bacterium]